MARSEYKSETSGELTDIPMAGGKDFRDICIGNCHASFQLTTKTFSFCTSSDDEWPLKSAENFRRLMEYIEITYGR